MTPEQEQAQLDAIAKAIQRQAQAAFEQMLARMGAGDSPREAIDAVTAQFSSEYYAELSAAFSAILDRSMGIAEIKAWPVGEVALSKHLYRHTQEVNAVTRRLIAEQAKGFVQARELAMQIYEGYRFKEDPLKVKAKLPKYLRDTLRDPNVDGGFARLIAQIRVNQLKTPALKAAYQQALDALEQGAGANRMKNLLRTAWYERNRFFANRIAQTELHRAYSNQVAQEIMADEAAVWVKYQMSVTHPKVDICDRHAKLNGWGKGPGIYPKAQAPKPPAHPFCRCTVRPAYEVEGEPGQPVKDAEQRFMNRLSFNDQRLIAGSRDRLQQFRDGRSLESIYNEGKNPIYRWGQLSDPVDGYKTDVAQESAMLEKPWKEGTDQAAWHDKSFQDSSDPIKKAIQAHDHRLQSVKANPQRGAYYQKFSKYIEMGNKDLNTYYGQGVFRHEYGHFLDNAIADHDGGQVAFRSSYSDFMQAMQDDMQDALRNAGMGRASKANTAFNAERASSYAAINNDFMQLDKAARKATIATKAKAVGLSDNDVMLFFERETTHIDDILARDVRANRLLSAIDRGDPMEFMEAIHEGLDWHQTDAIYKKGIIGKFSDLIGSGTRNKLLGHGQSGNGGHSNAYYKKGSEYAPTEVFANLTALIGANDKVWTVVLERMTPRLVQKFTEIMNGQ